MTSIEEELRAILETIPKHVVVVSEGDAVSDLLASLAISVSKIVQIAKDQQQRADNLASGTVFTESMDAILEEQQDQIRELRAALRELLLCRDTSWTGGHDWQDALEQAEEALDDSY